MNKMVINPPYKVRVAPSPIHGVGVFAIQKIWKGEVFEVAPVLELPTKRGGEYNILPDYRFFFPRNSSNQIHVLGLGYSSFYNHSENPNAEWTDTKGQKSFDFYALRNIEVGEEITVYYGDSSYWESTGQKLEIK
jgi:SET domain-containing protein